LALSACLGSIPCRPARGQGRRTGGYFGRRRQPAAASLRGAAVGGPARAWRRRPGRAPAGGGATAPAVRGLLRQRGCLHHQEPGGALACTCRGHDSARSAFFVFSLSKMIEDSGPRRRHARPGLRRNHNSATTTLPTLLAAGQAPERPQGQAASTKGPQTHVPAAGQRKMGKRRHEAERCAPTRPRQAAGIGRPQVALRVGAQNWPTYPPRFF
jgi:hypothetical protein